MSGLNKHGSENDQTAGKDGDNTRLCSGVEAVGDKSRHGQQPGLSSLSPFQFTARLCLQSSTHRRVALLCIFLSFNWGHPCVSLRMTVKDFVMCHLVVGFSR